MLENVKSPYFFIIILLFFFLVVYQMFFFFSDKDLTEAAIQDIEKDCPLTDQLFLQDLDAMQKVFTPLFDVATPHHPQYTYGQLFLIEENKLSPAFSFTMEEVNLSNQELHKILQEIQENYVPALMQTKEYFDRPRPKHIAPLVNISFPIHDMPSAQVQAMPSGHATQALLVGCMAVRDGRLTKQSSLRNVARYCLEVGMRRVIGGVHYPSDVHGAILFVKNAVHGWPYPLVHQLMVLYEEYEARSHDMLHWWS